MHSFARPRRWESFLSWLVFFDATLLAALYLGLVALRNEVGGIDQFTLANYATMLLISGFSIYLVGGYQRSPRLCTVRFISEYAIACGFALISSFAVIYTFQSFGDVFQPARLTILLTLLLFYGLALFFRVQLGFDYARTSTHTQLFLYGRPEHMRSIWRIFMVRRLAFRVRCFTLDPKRVGERLTDEDADSPILEDGLFEQAERESESIEAIVLTEPTGEYTDDDLQHLIRLRFSLVPLDTVSTFFARQFRMVPLSVLGPEWAFEEGFQLSSRSGYNRVKRVFDVAVAGTASIAVAPIVLLCALLIKLESRGPAFYRQTRIGKNGRKFTVYKLRSMREAAPAEGSGSLYTVKGDKRVTRLGYFLRKTRIDELPQLLNVLRGEMSIIGPRPEWDKLVEGYEKRIPFYHYRHLVKPGITGWAQVNYPYGQNDIDTVEKLRYDLYYAQHCTLLLDLTICLKTIYIMVTGKGQ